MHRTMHYVSGVILLLMVATVISGCPLLPIGGDAATLVPSMTVLNFGSSAGKLTFTVTKSLTQEPMGPLTVTATEPWITPLGCVSTADGCISAGPADPISISVCVDRGKTVRGTNRGALTLVAEGTANVSIEVIVEDAIEADFSASIRTPQAGQVVEFKDLSRTAAGAVVSWLWDFGDGATSTLAAPQHAYAAAGSYSVSLSVSTGSAQETLRREGFIVVGGAAPSADFSVSPAQIFQGDTVSFTDLSTSSAGPILSWSWDFGDGATSSEANPQHVFMNSGVYTVELTVVTADASGSATRSLQVASRVPPLARLSVEPVKPNLGLPAQFTDLSRPGSAPITEWLWQFGDGGMSVEQHPTHIYQNTGFFDVILTVTTAHGTDSTTLTGVQVRHPSPDADFEASNVSPATGEDVLFTDKSVSQGAPIIHWLWNFGDGETSTERNPVHAFRTAGTFTVSLTVTADQPTNNSDTETKKSYIVAADGGAGDISILRDFVNRPDPFYGYNYVASYDKIGAMIHVFKMTSQSWRSPGEVAKGRIWNHYITLIEPDVMPYHTALLFIDGGSSNSPVPNEENTDEFLVQFAMAAGTPVVRIQNVPAQPITFTDEVGIRENRTEDDIIAYSYDRYMASFSAGTPDNDWPLLFPMTKAAVRAMDLAQEAFPLVSGKAPEDAQIEDFVVAGGSKRGWTTWLTGAVDSRVRAIIPLVIDVLNMDEQMQHHFRSYGYWAPAIYPYAQEQVFDRFGTPGGEALLKLVDPFEYRSELQMPKLILNSTGDQFFLPDSSQFYLDSMLGESHVIYVANTEHSLDNAINVLDDTSALSSVLAFYMAVVQEVPRPEISWTFEDDGTIRVKCSERPELAVMWQAFNEDSRDFRRDTIGESWIPTVLSSGTDGTVAGKPFEVPGAWNAAYIQVAFANDAKIVIPPEGFAQTPQFVFSTPVRVRPDTYPPFPGERRFASGGTAGDPVFLDYLVLHGTPYEMGFDHGQLMQDEIQESLPRYIAAAVTENPLITVPYLDAMWDSLTSGTPPLLDQRIIDEIEGIADGAQVPLELIARTNMVPIVESYDGHSNALWDAAVSSPSNDFFHTFSQNQNLERITQFFPLAVVYIPTKGVPHTTLSYAGFAMSPVGVNVGGISVTALGQPGALYSMGTPHFLSLFRSVLYDTTSLRDALALVNQTPLSLSTTFILADGRNETRAAKIRIAPPAVPITWFENDSSDEFSPNVKPGLVYAGLGGAGFDAIDELYGDIGPIQAQSITNDLAAPGMNIQNVVINNFTLDLYTAYSEQLDTNGEIAEAAQRPYTYFNMQLVLP